MSLRERTAVVGVIGRELLARRRVRRTPEPQAVMSEQARVEAYAAAALEDEVMAPIYLFHCAQSAQLIRAGDTVVDLGCGPATELAILARLHPRANFVGVDLSMTMLSRARRHVARLGLHNVSLRQASMTDLAFLPDQSIDVVFSTMALHHLPALSDLQRTLCEAARVLRRDGGIYLADFARLRSAAAIWQLSQQYAQRQAPAFTKDYLDSLHAAFSKADFAASLAPLAPIARLYCMRPTTFMLAVKSAPRCDVSPTVQRGLAKLDAELPQRHRADLFFLRAMFRLGGLASVETKPSRRRTTRALSALARQLGSQPGARI